MNSIGHIGHYTIEHDQEHSTTYEVFVRGDSVMRANADNPLDIGTDQRVGAREWMLWRDWARYIPANDGIIIY